MNTTNKTAVEEWKINWKAEMQEKLFDAQVSPATIVRIIEVQEKLIEHLTTQSHQQGAREVIEKAVDVLMNERSFGGPNVTISMIQAVQKLKEPLTK